ncbi:MAG: DUF819 family protein [Bacteroidales bacterium]
MITVLLVAGYLFLPALILLVCRKVPFASKLGAVVIAYIVGLVLGNSGLLPEQSTAVQNILTTLTIPLALPLLLFSANVKGWFTMAGKTMLSMAVALVSVMVMVAAGYLLFRGQGMEELWKIGGMLVGVYSGGTPNLASLQMMLDVSPDTYIITHTYDMALSTVYLFFLMVFGRRVFGSFLPAYPQHQEVSERSASFSSQGGNPYQGLFHPSQWRYLGKGLLATLIVFAVGGGVSLLMPENMQTPVAILLITTLGIGGSLIPAVYKLPRTFDLGMYFILVFSVVVASMADITQFSGSAPGLLKYISFVVFGTLLLHALLARLFKIDADTLMISSTALICSPPFVPVVAGALKNRQVIISGLTVGIIGYAAGNYLGYLMAQVLQWFGH